MSAADPQHLFFTYFQEGLVHNNWYVLASLGLSGRSSGSVTWPADGLSRLLEALQTTLSLPQSVDPWADNEQFQEGLVALNEQLAAAAQPLTPQDCARLFALGGPMGLKHNDYGPYDRLDERIHWFSAWPAERQAEFIAWMRDPAANPVRSQALHAAHQKPGSVWQGQLQTVLLFPSSAGRELVREQFIAARDQLSLDTLQPFLLFNLYDLAIALAESIEDDGLPELARSILRELWLIGHPSDDPLTERRRATEPGGDGAMTGPTFHLQAEVLALWGARPALRDAYPLITTASDVWRALYLLEHQRNPLKKQFLDLDILSQLTATPVLRGALYDALELQPGLRHCADTQAQGAWEAFLAAEAARRLDSQMPAASTGTAKPRF